MAMNPDQIEALSSMLLGGDAAVQDRDESRRAAAAPVEKNNPNAGVDPLFKTVIKSGPTSRSSAAASATGAAPAAAAAAAAPAPASRPDPRAIWSPSEVLSLRELEPDSSYDLSDGRAKPDYDILYAQALSAEDVFMGLSGKDGSTDSCEALTVKIAMPGEAYRNVVLDVTPSRLLVRSVKYKLFLHLPHTVDERAGRAKWDERKETLSVTLPIVKRDDDDEQEQQQ